MIPDLRYLVEDREIARIENVTLSHPSRWNLDIGALDLNTCASAKFPVGPQTVAPKTLAQWQAVLPNTWLTIHRLTLSPWQQWQGELQASLTPPVQEVTYNGEQVSFKGQLRGQTLSVSQFDVQLPDQPQPIKLVGEFTLPLVPDGVPVKGHAVATFNVPQLTSLVDADLDWEDNQGQLLVMAPR